MKKLKWKILQWNKEHFKNIFLEKEGIEAELDKLNETTIKDGMDKEKHLKEKELFHKYEDILSKEENFWKKKCRENWLSDGDKNTFFFIIELRKEGLQIEFLKSKVIMEI